MPNQPYQILVVEDNDADVFLIREAIKDACIDADVHVVPDGPQAMEFFDAADADENAPCPDLVLLDLNLPRRNGEDVLRHMRASRTCKDALVLIVTSSGSVRDRENTQALGANAFFGKPFNYNEYMKLGTTVKTLLESAERSPERAGSS